MSQLHWLLFLPQLPSSPSSLRVLVWRRMRTMGAITLQNGVWVFPTNPKYEVAVRELLHEIEEQGASGLLFSAIPLNDQLEEQIIERFRTERDREYSEFLGQSRNFLAEIEKETLAQNFTFAEFEENDQDLQKLIGWLHKIQLRDTFEGHLAAQAIAALAACQEAMQKFTQKVYTNEGVENE